MNEMFNPFLDTFVIDCFDDILVYSKNEEERDNHLCTILCVLGKQKLYSKFSKCEFLLRSVAFFWAYSLKRRGNGGSSRD